MSGLSSAALQPAPARKKWPMFSLTLEPTNACNRSCLHCMRNKADPVEHLPLELAQHILEQARSLGVKNISLTGGEVAVYPHLENLVRSMVEMGFKVSLMTNGFRFQERLFPLLSQPSIRMKLEGVGFSLDGARAETHDALRGEGSFQEVMQALLLCQAAGLPASLKSIVISYNRDQLTELAHHGALLDVCRHQFLPTCPTPALIEKGIVPSFSELAQTAEWVSTTLSRMVRGKSSMDGYWFGDQLFTCCAFSDLTVDYQGNLIFCCNLSHYTAGDGVPTTFGRERLADLKETPLKEGVIRHFRLLAQLVEARLRDADTLTGATKFPCFWCLKYFGKMEWLRDFPQSPWKKEILGPA